MGRAPRKTEEPAASGPESIKTTRGDSIFTIIVVVVIALVAWASVPPERPRSMPPGDGEQVYEVVGGA